MLYSLCGGTLVLTYCNSSSSAHSFFGTICCSSQLPFSIRDTGWLLTGTFFKTFMCCWTSARSTACIASVTCKGLLWIIFIMVSKTWTILQKIQSLEYLLRKKKNEVSHKGQCSVLELASKAINCGSWGWESRLSCCSFVNTRGSEWMLERRIQVFLIMTFSLFPEVKTNFNFRQT